MHHPQGGKKLNQDQCDTAAQICIQTDIFSLTKLKPIVRGSIPHRVGLYRETPESPVFCFNMAAH